MGLAYIKPEVKSQSGQCHWPTRMAVEERDRVEIGQTWAPGFQTESSRPAIIWGIC